MKKKYLMYAGIVSAAILVILFAAILLTGSFTIFSTVAIDPIPDHAAGDLVVITGTTNLNAGTRLELDIIAPTPPGTRAGVTDAFIVRGGGMANSWSGALDTSAIPPGEYLVNAYRMNETFGRSDLLASSRLRLTNATPDPDKITRRSANHTLSFINIDRPGTINRGEKILISGTTNLPRDTQTALPRHPAVQHVGPHGGPEEPETGDSRRVHAIGADRAPAGRQRGQPVVVCG